MTKFADQLLDDLMREHGPALAAISPPAPPSHRVKPRRALLAGGSTIAVSAAIIATLDAGSGTPAYAVTKNPDGTITLAVYQTSGIAGADARLRQLGDKQVVVVPIKAGCPRPAGQHVPAPGKLVSTGIAVSRNGSVIVKARGIPAGTILVIGMETTAHGRASEAIMTSPPAPSCLPAPPPPGNGGSGS